MTSVEDIFTRYLANLAGRVHGPLTFRLVLQPTMASILAIRAGLRDARAGRSPYLWMVTRNPRERRRLLREGFRTVAMVFTVAILVDTIYQLIVFNWFYPLEALTVAAMLAFVPFVIVRGPTTRIALRFFRRRGTMPKGQRT